MVTVKEGNVMGMDGHRLPRFLFSDTKNLYSTIGWCLEYHTYVPLSWWPQKGVKPNNFSPRSLSCPTIVWMGRLASIAIRPGLLTEGRAKEW